MNGVYTDQDYEVQCPRSAHQEPSFRRPRWLIILDNFDGTEVAQQLWTSGGRRSVIIITRSLELGESFGQENIEVPAFTENESLEFLMRKNIVADWTNDNELKAARSIAANSDNLPSELDYIATLFKAQPLSYSGLARSHEHSDIVFPLKYGQTEWLYQDIRDTWVDVLEEIDESARSLVEKLVLFDTDGIPIELLNVEAK